jgi:hypothetical protein
MSNFENLSIFSDFWTSIKLPKVPSDLFYGGISLTKLKVLSFLGGICMGGTLRMSNFKNLSIFSGSWTSI